MPRAGAAIAALLFLLAAACAPRGAGLNHDALDDAIADAIGDPYTCVLLAEAKTRKVVYRYGEAMTCGALMPACDRPGTMTVADALPLAATPGGRTVSCASNPQATRGVSWAEGKVESRTRDLIFSARMEGTRALPGREVAVRLQDALAKAGV